MRTKLHIFFFLSACLALATGCDDAGGDGQTPAEDAAAEDTAGVQDTAQPLDTADAAGTDEDSFVPVFDNGAEAGTDAGTDVEEADAEPDAVSSPCDFADPSPGACGWSCANDNECLSGFCVPTRGDRLCTLNCGVADCPDGWVCRQLASAPDTIFGCVPQSPNLGRPCKADLDCIAAIGQTVVGLQDYCVTQGNDGAFCGSDCAAGQKCPAGFACQTVQTLAGKQAKQCVPAKVDDNCTQRYELEKAETACTVANAQGACKGKRGCVGTALGPCDAKTPAAETCNFEDDDCDGQLNEPVPGATCLVQSPLGACPGKPVCEGGVETCIGEKPKAEACNGVDDDCDGQTDEGCDDDQDGVCDGAMLYDPSAGVCAKGGGDCNDLDASVFPGAKELCNGFDDDCNGAADALDAGLVLSDPQQCENQKGVCAGAKKGGQLCQGGKWLPCADEQYQQHNPAYGKVEVCDDKDNDCSGSADGGCDDDQDGYCDAAIATIGFPLSCPKGGGDCDDQSKAVIPGAAEVCDDLDQNCNGQTDELCDKDKDGQCDGALQVVGTPKVCPKGGGDCDDLDKSRFVGAVEQCNGKDDDCSGKADEPFAGLGNTCQAGQGECQQAGTVVCAPDGSAAVCSVQAGKAGTEICDGLDNDCNGKIDEGCDDDFDGWCDVAMPVLGKPKVCFNGGGDCNDLDGLTKPGAKEVCNGVDDDCDGKTDGGDGDLLLDDPKSCEKQAGVCKGAKKPASLCVAGKWLPCAGEHYAGWSGQYGASETCDSLDNDCNGKDDDGCDEDDDDYCAATMPIAGFVKTCPKGSGDCDDSNASIHPFAEELCDNKDNDCNFKTDDGCDDDFDNWCDAGKVVIGTPTICPAGKNDCNDTDPKVNPGAKDVCADFLDNNCDDVPDDGCPPTIIGFSGQQGPNFYADGFLQCSGFFDQPSSEDVPLAFGASCVDPQWTKLRIACGVSKDKVRYIDVKKNVFKDGLLNNAESGLIYNSNFDLQGNNLIKADASSPNAARSWWVASTGCSETSINLTVNNTSCVWEAANCFGQNIAGSRYLYVYVGK